MNIDFEKIKKECPKSYNGFVYDYVHNNYETDNIHCSDDQFFSECIDTDVICFCDFVEFFDENKMIISIIYDLCTDQKWYIVLDVNGSNYHYYPIGRMPSYNTRIEAQEAAIYKSFEIMEGIC